MTLARICAGGPCPNKSHAIFPTIHGAQWTNQWDGHPPPFQANHQLYALALLEIARVLKPTGRSFGRSNLWVGFFGYQKNTFPFRDVFKRQRLGAVLITAATDSNDSAMKAAIAAAELEMVRRLGWIMGWGNECQKPWLLWLVPFQNSRLSMTLKNLHNLPHLHSDTQCTLHPSTYFFSTTFGRSENPFL